MVREVEIGEETERAEGEREDWGDDALEEPGGEKNGAISAELHGECVLECLG